MRRLVIYLSLAGCLTAVLLATAILIVKAHRLDQTYRSPETVSPKSSILK